MKKSKPLVLYHGTLVEFLPRIFKKGLLPSEGWGGAGTVGVFLSKTKDSAAFWAKWAYMRHAFPDELKGPVSFDREFGRVAKKLITVLQVTIPVRQLKHLKADMEQAEDVLYEGDEDDWETSLREIGDARFDKKVPAAWIKDVGLPKPKKKKQ